MVPDQISTMEGFKTDAITEKHKIDRFQNCFNFMGNGTEDHFIQLYEKEKSMRFK